YPHYIGRVDRVDGTPHSSAVQAVTWQDREALQLSRKSNRGNPSRDTAALKAERGLSWLGTPRTHPPPGGVGRSRPGTGLGSQPTCSGMATNTAPQFSLDRPQATEDRGS